MGFAAAGGRTHGSQVQRASSPTNCPLMLSHHEWARQTILRAQRQGPAELLRLRPYTHDLQACHVASASRSSARFQIARIRSMIVHFSQENNKFSKMTFAVTSHLSRIEAYGGKRSPSGLVGPWYVMRSISSQFIVSPCSDGVVASALKPA